MPLAKNDRPDTKPSAEPTAQVDSWEIGDDRTPVEGCSPRRRAIPPASHETTSTKSRASDAELDDIFSPESWDPDPPDAEAAEALSCTPAPVVIGLNTAARPSQAPELELNQQGLTEDWRDPGAKNTPAEPVASRRVRQRASEKTGKRRSHSQRARGSANVCDDRIVTVTDLQPSAQYFPPMKPPESIPGHVATKPKVQIVPDCDTRLRTARSLRRRSSLPPSIHLGLRLTYGWPLYLLVAAAACITAIGLVRGLTLIMPTHNPAAPAGAAPTAPFPRSPSPVPTAQSRSGASLVEEPSSMGRRSSAAQGATRKGEQQPNTDSSSHKSIAPISSAATPESITDATVF